MSAQLGMLKHRRIAVMRGDHRGDPFVHRRVVGAVKGFVTGGPIGAAAGFIEGGMAGKKQPTAGPAAPIAQQPPRSRIPGIPVPGGSTGTLPFDPLGLFAPSGTSSGRGLTAQETNGIAPKGHRLNKTSYFLKDGTFVEKGTKWVKIRRRNPLNPRAADRAIGRLESAKKAVKRLNRVSIRKKC